MTIENLRKLHQARPFRPFAIHTADGSAFPVPHNEFLAYDSEGQTILVMQNNGTNSVLDLSLITELEVLSMNGKADKALQWPARSTPQRYRIRLKNLQLLTRIKYLKRPHRSLRADR